MTPQHLPKWSELHPSRGFAPDFLRLYGTTLTDADRKEYRLIVKPEVVEHEQGGQSVEEIRVSGFGIGAEIPPRTLLVDADGQHWNTGRGRRLVSGWWQYPLVEQKTT